MEGLSLDVIDQTCLGLHTTTTIHHPTINKNFRTSYKHRRRLRFDKIQIHLHYPIHNPLSEEGTLKQNFRLSINHNFLDKIILILNR